MSQSNFEFEKIFCQTGRHPRQWTLSQARYCKAGGLTNAPDLDRGHLTTQGLVAAVHCAQRCLAEHGIGEVAIVEAATRHDTLAIEIAWFPALARVKPARAADGDGLHRHQAGPHCWLCWRQPAGGPSHD